LASLRKEAPAETLEAIIGLDPVIVDLRLSTDHKASWLQPMLEQWSWWQGKMNVGGTDWQVVAIDELSAPTGPVAAKHLLLRPWAARTNRVYLGDPTSGLVEFPQKLFWMGHAFELSARTDNSGDAPVCRLRFAPAQPRLRELSRAGDFLEYAVLVDTNGYVCVLTGNQLGTKMPEGAYSVSATWLQRGATVAFRLPGQQTVFDARIASTFPLGGPLTNSVSLTRTGKNLLLEYQVSGSMAPAIGSGSWTEPILRNSPSITQKKECCRANLSLAEVAPARTHGEYLYCFQAS
jgi:hypothetical protein